MSVSVEAPVEATVANPVPRKRGRPAFLTREDKLQYRRDYYQKNKDTRRRYYQLNGLRSYYKKLLRECDPEDIDKRNELEAKLSEIQLSLNAELVRNQHYNVQ